MKHKRTKEICAPLWSIENEMMCTYVRCHTSVW